MRRICTRICRPTAQHSTGKGTMTLAMVGTENTGVREYCEGRNIPVFFAERRANCMAIIIHTTLFPGGMKHSISTARPLLNWFICRDCLQTRNGIICCLTPITLFLLMDMEYLKTIREQLAMIPI